MVWKVISGGQTGADRGGLDAAIELGVSHGGWCPRKRRAEDGRVPDRYKLDEHVYYGYRHRTAENVKEADATVIFLYGDESDPGVRSGSKMTAQVARRNKKPLCEIDLEQHGVDGAASLITSWIDNCEAFGMPIRVLNVAGKRESKAPGIQKAVKKVMLAVLEVSASVVGPADDQRDASQAQSNEQAMDGLVDGKSDSEAEADEPDEPMLRWEDI